MDPGKFSQPITILERVKKTDEANESTDTWRVFATTRANIVYQSGFSAIRDDRESFSTLASIMIYSLPKLEPTMNIEVKYYDRPGVIGDVARFNIESVAYLDNNRYMSLACRRIY